MVVSGAVWVVSGCCCGTGRVRFTLLCFSLIRALTVSYRCASLGEASVKTKISDSGGLCIRANCDVEANDTNKQTGSMCVSFEANWLITQ